MMRPMAAAAGRQARLCVGRKERRKRSKPEQQNHSQAYDSPHREHQSYSELFVPLCEWPKRAQDQTFLHCLVLITREDE
jgi:hypothetical protein